MLQFIASLGNLIPGLFGRKLAYQTAKIIGFAILALLVVLVLILGKCSYDASVVNRAETEHRAEAAERQLAADRAADAEMANKAAAFDNSQEHIEQLTRDAAKADPKGAAEPVGPVTRSYYEGLPRRKK